MNQPLVEPVTNNDLKALEAFVLDNPDLERLEAELAHFNIFEAVGMVSQEIRHSHFLAFLLNPSENHGLGEIFLKRILMKTLSEAVNAPFSLIDIDVTDLSRAIVKTEWENIDISIVDELNHLVVAIENKIYGDEHGNQLKTYFEVVQRNYPTSHYKQVFIFLTPFETQPSNDKYLVLSYGTVANTLDDIRQIYDSTIGAEVSILIEHYTTMLRRHIVSDSTIAELCRKIWNSNHRQALELLLEHRPDVQQEIMNFFKEAILSQPELQYESKITRALSFTPRRWDNINLLVSGPEWGGSRRLLRFWLNKEVKGVYLSLYLLPSPNMELRQAIFNFTQQYDAPFNSDHRMLTKQWKYLYSVTIVETENIEGKTFDDLISDLKSFWQRFIENDLPAICNVIENEIPWAELEAQLKTNNQ